MAQRETYSDDEVLAALQPRSPRTLARIRDRLMLRMLWVAGLKPAELLALRPDDVQFDRVYVGPRYVKVAVPLQSAFKQDLVEWHMERREIATLRDDSPLLCNALGDELEPSYLRYTLAEMSTAAGLQRPLNATGLRNTFAARLRAAGTPLPVIRDQLGHTSVEYTAAYLATMSTENANP